MQPTLKQKIWYYLTWWRPISKREFLQLQKNIVIIFEGMKEGDLQHYQIEHELAGSMIKLKQLIETKEKNKELKQDDMMIS